MALVAEFEHVSTDRNSIHEPVTCGWKIFNEGETTVLQLDTYGRAQRAMPGKGSQTIQLDRVAAAQLLGLLQQAFPGLKPTP